MSSFPVTPDQIETFTIVTNPFRQFVTSSLGATGSVFVFPRRTSAEKDFQEIGTVDVPYSDSSVMAAQLSIRNALTSSTNIKSQVAQYMSAVDALQPASKYGVSLPVFRYTPTPTFTENTLRKNTIRSLLLPFYRVDYPSFQWAYTNYNCLSFFTASSVSPNAALLYPNVVSSPSPGVSGSYVLTGSFTFDFYVNPRIRTQRDTDVLKAGTIMHLSSCYALSLVTGSQKDYNGRTQGYRLMLQLSHSADIPPSTALPGNYPSNLIFLSDDNSLQWNNWHHVVIRWGTNTTNSGTGSFLIDGVNRGTFVIPSASIAPQVSAVTSNPDVLVIGNYYEGNNTGANATAFFFATNPATRDGLPILISDPSAERPASYAFTHPLNADIHDLLIRNAYVFDDSIVSGSGLGPTSLSNAVFYLPPYFTRESPTRQFVGTFGGVPQTPFFAANGTTTDPFNVAMSFGVGGHLINTENFTMDLANTRFPRLHELTASLQQGTTAAVSANDFIYGACGATKRNLLVMPCDDGNFIPNFDLLSRLSNEKFVDDLGFVDNSWISLNDMLPTSSLFSGVTEESGSIFNILVGSMPEYPGVQPGEALAIFQRTRDASSNAVTFFDISNLYYGLRILPETFKLTDPTVSGSNGRSSADIELG